MLDTKTHETGKPTSPEDTRERILTAAREAIGRKGKRGATTREIADAAGVNEATLFRHFGNKEALIIATVRHYCGEVELKDAIAQLAGPLEDDLFAIATRMHQRMVSHSDIIRWSLVEVEYERSVFAETAWRPQIALLDLVAGYMEKQIAAGTLRGTPRALAFLFLGMVFAHVLSSKKFSEVEIFPNNDAALRFYVDVFLNGVRAK